jgi:hypothetical protein
MIMPDVVILSVVMSKVVAPLDPSEIKTTKNILCFGSDEKKIDFVENIWAATKKYQKVPKSTKKYQKVPKSTKKYQKVPKITKKYQKVPKSTKKYQKVPKRTKKYQKVRKKYQIGILVATPTVVLKAFLEDMSIYPAVGGVVVVGVVQELVL